jgi:hypothetical protein
MNLPRGMRSCPTRADGEPVLFTHAVTPSLCQDRQRGHYHKCWSCAHMNGAASHNGARHALPLTSLLRNPKQPSRAKSIPGVGVAPSARP